MKEADTINRHLLPCYFINHPMGNNQAIHRQPRKDYPLLRYHRGRVRDLNQ